MPDPTLKIPTPPASEPKSDDVKELRRILAVAINERMLVDMTILRRLLDRLERAERERDHWRSNHDEFVNRNQLLRNRLDLPMERVCGYDGMIKRLEDLKQENSKLKIIEQKYNQILGILHEVGKLD